MSRRRGVCEHTDAVARAKHALDIGEAGAPCPAAAQWRDKRALEACVLAKGRPLAIILVCRCEANLPVPATLHLVVHNRNNARTPRLPLCISHRHVPRSPPQLRRMTLRISGLLPVASVGPSQEVSAVNQYTHLRLRRSELDCFAQIYRVSLRYSRFGDYHNGSCFPYVIHQISSNFRSGILGAVHFSWEVPANGPQSFRPAVKSRLFGLFDAGE